MAASGGQWVEAERSWALVCAAYDRWIDSLPRQYELCRCTWVPYLWPANSRRRTRMSSCYRFFFALLSHIDWCHTWDDVAPQYRGRKYLREFMPDDRRPLIPHPQVVEIMRRPQEIQLSPRWFAARKPSRHLTASVMKTIFLAQPGRAYASAEGVFRAKTARAAAAQARPHGDSSSAYDNTPCRHGRAHEKVANVRYEETEHTLVCAVGLLEHPTHPFLAASPDGIRIDAPIAVEYKCPFVREDVCGLLQTYWYQCQLQAQCMAPAVHSTHLFLFWTDSYAPPRLLAWEYYTLLRDDRWFTDVALPLLQRLWARIQDAVALRVLQGQEVLYTVEGDQVKPVVVVGDGDDPDDEHAAATSDDSTTGRKRPRREVTAANMGNQQNDTVVDHQQQQQHCTHFVQLGPFKWAQYGQ